jgi:aspartyl protease family protein
VSNAICCLNLPRRHAWAVAAAFSVLIAGGAQAQSVAMTGGMGSKALLVIDGGAPKAMSAGDSHKGVKVISVTSASAVVEVGGQRQTVMLGGAPVSQGGSGGSGSTGSQIVLTAGSGGHFMTRGSINGKSVEFMVDTGATTVAMGHQEARRLGIDFEKGQRGYSSTANGNVATYRVKVDRVRIQDVEVHGIEVSVLNSQMPYILLGNSFLTRFQMKRENDQMTLTKRF